MKQMEIDEDAKRGLEARAMLRGMTKVNPAEINHDVSRIKHLAKELEEAIDQYSSRMGNVSRSTADFFISPFRSNLRALINRIALDVVYQHAGQMPPNLRTDPTRLVFDMGQCLGWEGFDATFLEDRAVEAYVTAKERSFHQLLCACQRMLPVTVMGEKTILRGRVLSLFIHEYDDFNDSVAVVSKLSNVLFRGENPAYAGECTRVPPRGQTGKGYVGEIVGAPAEPIRSIKHLRNGRFLVGYNSEKQARAMAKLLLAAAQEEADALWRSSKTNQLPKKEGQP